MPDNVPPKSDMNPRQPQSSPSAGRGRRRLACIALGLVLALGGSFVVWRQMRGSSGPVSAMPHAMPAGRPDAATWPTHEALQGEWPCYRGDAHNSASSPLTGSAGRVAVAWRSWCGYWEGLVEIAPAAGTSHCRLGPEECGAGYMDDNRSRFALARLADACGDGNAWAVRPRSDVQSREQADVTGDGQALQAADLVEDFRTRWAPILRNAEAEQMVQFEDGGVLMQRADRNFSPDACGRLWSFAGGRKQLVWKTAMVPVCEAPTVALADMRHRGSLDVVIVTWCRAVVFDGNTGQQVMECEFDEGRNYGYMEVADLNGDGFPDIVVLGDFTNHMDVLVNDGNNLSLQWRKPIEDRLFQKKTVLHTGVSPVADLEGNGHKCLAVSLFNEKGDYRWHVMIYDAFTGKELADLPDWHLDGVTDLDGDGAAELLLGETNGLAQAIDGKLAIGRLRGGRLALEPLAETGRWMTTSQTFFASNKSSVANPRDNRTAAVMPCGGGKWAAVALHAHRGRPTQTVAAYGLNPPRRAARVWQCELPSDLDVAVKGIASPGGDAAGSVLLSVTCARADGGEAAARDCAVYTRSWNLRPREELAAPIVARLRPRDAATILLETAPGAVLAMSCREGPSRPPVQQWCVQGRGMSFAWPKTVGLAAADIDGDGEKEVLVAARESGGQAALVALGSQGTEKYRHVFTRFNGEDPAWNLGSILYWKVGRFLDPNRLSVAVSLRRGTMHTEETCVLDLPSGDEAWWQDNVGERGCGGSLFALADVDADGLDDLVCLYPDITYALSGKTGRVLGWSEYEQAELGGWCGYGQPILCKLKGSAELSLFQAAGTWQAYQIARRALDRRLLWHTPYGQGTHVLPEIGDVDGDGKDELGAICGGVAQDQSHGDWGGEFRCFDAAGGGLKWRLDLPRGPATDVVARLQATGAAEFIFGKGSHLLAVSGGPQGGFIKWQVELPGILGSPVLADVDGDGQCEILVTCQDGFLYCIKGDSP